MPKKKYINQYTCLSYSQMYTNNLIVIILYISIYNIIYIYIGIYIYIRKLYV